MPQRKPVVRRACLAISLLLLVLILSPTLAQRRTALDDYVTKPDPAYKFELVNTIPGQGVTSYVIDMVSQTWLTSAEVDKPEWRHWLVIAKPDKVTSPVGLLLVGGGDNGREAPKSVDAGLTMIAQGTGTVVAELRQIPNQPLVFVGDGKPRKEDSMIAYAWDKYLHTGDPKWAPRLPMTKAVVRAMDTITACLGSLPTGPVEVNKFVITGGSKRGWTTWTTGAVDKRVVGIMPLVIDLLNVQKSFEHHFMVYGFWAPAIHDYEEMGIMSNWIGTPQFASLMQLVDPYSYLDRYATMPKYLVNATGDQFFLPDSWKFYWKDLKGPKFLRYVPNGDHSLRNTDARFSMMAFYSAIVKGTPLPQFDWVVGDDGTIRVKTVTQPTEVKLWQATNPEVRDFRLEKIGAVWTATVLQPAEKGEYRARVQAPEKGWTAYFIEMTYPSPVQSPFKFTSGLVVTPDKTTFPSPLKK